MKTGSKSTITKALELEPIQSLKMIIKKKQIIATVKSTIEFLCFLRKKRDSNLSLNLSLTMQNAMLYMHNFIMSLQLVTNGNCILQHALSLEIHSLLFVFFFCSVLTPFRNSNWNKRTPYKTPVDECNSELDAQFFHPLRSHFWYIKRYIRRKGLLVFKLAFIVLYKKVLLRFEADLTTRLGDVSL